MAKAIFGIEAYLRLVGVRATGHHQVTEQVFGVVAETSLALGGRTTTAAKIDFTSRQGAGATVAGGRFQKRYGGAGTGRFNSGAGARCAKADNDNIGFVIPLGDLPGSTGE
ncbi:hypothetical protein D3C76_1280920 [compost metagenome]